MDKTERDKLIVIIYDLYWLRFKKIGEQWYELTDYIKRKLEEDGIRIQFTQDDVVVNGLSIKNLVKEINDSRG